MGLFDQPLLYLGREMQVPIIVVGISADPRDVVCDAEDFGSVCMKRSVLI